MATPTQARRHPTVAFYGDSIVTGWRGTSSPRARWSSLVSDDLGWREVNLALDGMGYFRRRGPRGADGERQPSATDTTLLDALVRLEPDAVVVCLSANDIRFLPDRADEVRAAIDRDHRRLAEDLPGRPVLVTTYFPTRELSDRAAQMRAWITDAAARWGHTHVAGFGTATADDPHLLCDDGVHPNDAGHRALADAILPACAALVGGDRSMRRPAGNGQADVPTRSEAPVRVATPS
ncbi:SGNH/GDSL hydrolase family protein [Luteimicrobium sp. DT211]|uniref:SGNH/GDSL hydrolase family protein n=1 Tax=Luteimicrobium sp. DT211 TaxID=3393412 RepID=UPI003CECA8C1